MGYYNESKSIFSNFFEAKSVFANSYPIIMFATRKLNNILYICQRFTIFKVDNDVLNTKK